jgi:hypothetical protein
MTTVATVPLAGRCTCGAVRYRLDGPPLFVHCCHCTWCQRESGSAFAINILIETARVALLEGTVDRTDLPSASGAGQTLCRCPSCQVVVWSHYAAARDRIAFVRAGTLDDPAAVTPDIHIYTSTKLPWVALPAGVPAVPAYYRRADHWPAASIARYEAVREAMRQAAPTGSPS